MANRLRDLEEQLQGQRRPRLPPGLPKVARNTQAATPAPRTSGKGAASLARAVAWSASAFEIAPRGRGFTLALSRSFDYVVPGAVPAIAQPLPNACWATVATMMASWRDGKPLDIRTAMGGVGPKWLRMYDADTGLDAADKAAFLAAAGLVAEPPQNRTIEGWETFLRKYGPLWVTTDEGGVGRFSPHARILSGIRSDGGPENTMVDVVDPGGGTRYTERFLDFVKKYESDVRQLATPRIQIVHWKEGAQMSSAKSRALSVSPWSTYFPFGKGVKYAVDGPLTHNGSGECLESRDTFIKFTMDIPSDSARLVFELTYKAEGAGNRVVAVVNGTRFEDPNATIASAGTSRTIQLSRPTEIFGKRVSKLAVSASGPKGRVTIWADGTDYDFDLERK